MPHPYVPFCRHIILTLHFIFLENNFGLISVSFTHANTYQGSMTCSDLLLRDHVCERSDAVNWIDCP